MPPSFRALALVATVTLSSAASAQTAYAPAVTIDGFTVQKLPFPTKAVARRPEFEFGAVVFGAKPPEGTSPYVNTPLDGSPYLTIENGVATYLLHKSAPSVSFIWGTPDPYNNVTFYDGRGKSLGTLTGAHMMAMFGQTSSNLYRITGSAPIRTAIATSTTCCFESAGQMADSPPQ